MFTVKYRSKANQEHTRMCPPRMCRIKETSAGTRRYDE